MATTINTEPKCLYVCTYPLADAFLDPLPRVPKVCFIFNIGFSKKIDQMSYRRLTPLVITLEIWVDFTRNAFQILLDNI